MDKKKLEKRRQGVGGSDAAAVCGLSPYKTPYQVWLEKRGQATPQVDNEAMFWGRALEPVIRQKYADLTSKLVTIPDEILIHPKFSWVIGSLDGITSDNRVLEIKTSRMPTGWGESGSMEIPEMYMIQVQHYLAITGFNIADVATLIGGSDFRLYEIPADKELQELIIEKERVFWSMVLEDIPPEPVSFADIKQRFGQMSLAKSLQTNPAVDYALAGLKAIKEMVKQEDALKLIVLSHLGEADTLIDENDKILATWKLAKAAKRFDLDAFKTAYPDLYGQFLTEGTPSRRFLIK